MNKTLRWILILIGRISVVVAIGFFIQAPSFTQLWPLQSSRLSNIFLSSIFAAIGCPIIWIGLSGERRAMAGGALNLLVTNAGFAISTFCFFSQSHQLPLLTFGIISTVMVVVTGFLIYYSRSQEFTNTHPLPWLIRVSFIIFAVTLLLVAIALIAQRPNTFPWPLSGENSIMYGWIFLGAMCYFLYAIYSPVWSNARGQLIGFLAYDLILIGPFLAHFQTVKPEMLLSLIIYTTVVSYSGLLAIYYLFIHPITRFSFLRKSQLDAVK
jgi:hypothetical protein